MSLISQNPSRTMTTICIPPELKLCIADHLDPSSSINFALTCKEHWRLCEPILKAHARGFAEAPVLNSHYTGTDLWQALKDVLRDPRKGWYITEISLMSSWSSHRHAAFEEDVDEFQKAATTLMDLYTPFSSDGMVEAGYFGLFGSHIEEECVVKKIRDSIAIGSPDGAVAILVHHLPNLKTLRMTMSREDDAFEVLLHWIAMEYSNAAKALHLPFQRLKTAMLSHYDTEGHVSVNWALPFLRIPSLRTFAANMMGGHFRGEKGRGRVTPGPPPRSNIEEFCFAACKFDARAVEYLVASTHSLKRFLYADDGACVGENMYDPKVVIKALDKYARHSLEHMVLDHMEYHEEEVWCIYPASPASLTFCRLYSVTGLLCMEVMTKKTTMTEVKMEMKTAVTKIPNGQPKRTYPDSPNCAPSPQSGPCSGLSYITTSP
jgi:hypothetical protein